jgi:predicted transcriptional regulator
MPQVQKVLDAFPDLDGGEKFAWIEPPAADKNGSYKKVPGFMGTANLSTKSSDNLRFFKRENGEIFAISGSDSAIQGILLHGDRFNRGDVAEALLGASLTAKLVKRGGDRIGKIGVDDVKTILNQAIARGDNTMVVRIQDKNSEIADNINFYLRLPTGSLAFMKNPANWDRVQDLFSSAIEYCNGTDAERYSNYFYRNGKVDDVRIVSDGVGGSKDRKTDVQAVVHETDPETGKVTKRSLKNVDISLKADSDIYGQHGTGGLKATPDKWLETSNALFNQIGVNITMPRYKNDIMKFFLNVYTQATQQLKTILAGANANKETAIIEKIADMLESQGSREKNPETKEWQPNKNLKLLSFKGGTYTMHSFSILKQQLLEKQINLTAEMIIGKRSGKPSILIKDITSGQLLTEIRFQMGTDKASNYFIKGPLMTELTKIEKHKHDPSNVAVGQAPTKTTPATAPEPAPATSGTIKPTGTTKAKSLSIEPVKHDATAFPQWKGRQPANPGLAPVGTVSGSTSNIPSTKRTVVPADDEVVAESKKRIK